MKRHPDPDYTFGQIMLTLRTTIGLTQMALAEFLGVSRRAVGAWEAGHKYPKAQHLKLFIELAFKHGGFPVSGEDEAIRALWKAARQKVLLDETWLIKLLATQPYQHRNQVASHASTTATRSHWEDALAIDMFYGREQELKLLAEWVVEDHCQVVSVLGIGGIGKSVLAITLMHQVAEQFEVVIWRSLRDLPTCETLFEDLIQSLASQAIGEMPIGVDQRLSLLLEYMRSTRALLVLDNLESVLEEGESKGQIRTGYEALERFLRQSAETNHKSCVLLTSREKPKDLMAQEGNQSPVRALRLAQLDLVSCEALLAEKGIAGISSDRAHLIDIYTGNPLALKIVAQTIVDLFGGEIGAFLEQGEVIFGGVRTLLSQQFVRLSNLEQAILFWLAILREPTTLDELLAVLVNPVPRSQLLESVDRLHRCSLIERGHKHGSFTLQSVVLEYLTARLTTEAYDEIHEGRLSRLIEHGLELAHAKDYIRQSQERLLVIPLLERLLQGQSDVNSHIRTLLNEIRPWSHNAQGYAPANLMTLLRLQRGNLRGIDFSRLTLRGVYLQGVEMQDATLAEVTIQDSIFTETFDGILAVAISSNGAYWAVSTRRGEIRIWDKDGIPLRQVWSAHEDSIWSLTFSPAGQVLVSGSWDGTFKLWDVATGSLLWSSRHAAHMIGVAFACDGSIVATGGPDATVRLWNTDNGAQLQWLPHPHPLNSLAWSPDGHILASGDTEGNIHLWEMGGAEATNYVQIRAAHAKLVDGLAFSPNSNILASASWDGTVKLWEMPGGHLLETLTGHSNGVRRVTWSPDGRLLASCGFGKAIRLWDAERRSYRAVLRGHAAEMTGIAFTSDGHRVLTGGEDGTLRLWDVSNGQCVRVMQGHEGSLHSIDWSPDGTQLVSGGSNRLVMIHSLNRETAVRILGETSNIVLGVGWSPDGQWLASSEWGNIIRLWDPDSGDCLQLLQHPDDPGNFFDGLAWSPDGPRLACGTSRRGVHVFQMIQSDTQWISQPFPTPIIQVAWSPDGGVLGGGCIDGTVQVWNAKTGALLKRLSGHYSRIEAVAWSQSGERLATVSRGREGGELFVWDILHGELEKQLTHHPRGLVALTWGCSEETVISGDSDGTLRWWDIQNGECLLVRQAHQGMIRALRRSPDGTKLASCGDDGAISVRDARSGELLKILRRDRPYERMNITGIRGLTEVQKVVLRTLGAIEDFTDSNSGNATKSI